MIQNKKESNTIKPCNTTANFLNNINRQNQTKMKILKFILIIITVCFARVSIANDSIYVHEVDKYCEVINYEVLNLDTINVVISYSAQELKYGKWKFYYSNGTKKSEGIFSLEGVIRCGTGPGPHIPH